MNLLELLQHTDGLEFIKIRSWNMPENYFDDWIYTDDDFASLHRDKFVKYHDWFAHIEPLNYMFYIDPLGSFILRVVVYDNKNK